MKYFWRFLGGLGLWMMVMIVHVLGTKYLGSTFSIDLSVGAASGSMVTYWVYSR